MSEQFSMSDTELLDWLEDNLKQLAHVSNPQMDGTRWVGQLTNGARGPHAGPSYIRIHHSTIRAAILEAMAWKPNT